jgi:hypothetical protein
LAEIVKRDRWLRREDGGSVEGDGWLGKKDMWLRGYTVGFLRREMDG